MDSKPSNSQPSNGARARYLDGLAPDKQVEVLLKAERLGPAPDDQADWLVAQAAADAALRIEDAVKRIEAASPKVEKSLELFNERLERVEQTSDDIKGRLEKARIGEREDIPGLRNPQLDRIESRQHEHAAKIERIEARVHREPTIASLPVAVHVVLVALMALCVGVGYYARILPSPASYVLVGAFVVLAYLYLAPTVGPSVATALHRLSRIGR